MVNFEFHHIVLIPTRNRPHLLERLLKSIIKNIEIFNYPNDNITVIIVDDSSENEKSERNRGVVERIQQKLHVIYYDKKKQNLFINDLRRHFSHLQYYIWDERTKRRGFGGIRNLCLLLGLYEAPENALFTFLDDDVVLANLVYELGRKKIKHVFSYFEKLDQAFEGHGGMNFAGGGYTRDTYEAVWVVVHLMWAIREFFDVALRKSSSDSSIEVFRKIIYEFPKPWSEVNYLLSDIKANINLGSFLRILGASCRLMKDYGSYRLIPTVYNPHVPVLIMWNPYSQGGNMSFRKSALEKGVPYPVGGWRGEDITWDVLMETMVGGGAKINSPVGHFKTMAGKRNIEVEIAKDFVFDFHLSIIRYLLNNVGNNRGAISNALTKRFDLSELGDFSEFPYSWYMKREWQQHFGFENWEMLLKDIRSKIERHGWFREKKYSNSLKRIYDFLGYIEEPKFIERIKSHVPPTEALFEATKKYGFLIGKWPELVRAVNQKKRIEGKVWTAKTKGVQKITKRKSIEDSVRELIEEIDAFVDFSEQAFTELDDIEEDIKSIDDPNFKKALIIEHDFILDNIDSLIEILEKKIENLLSSEVL